jgi:DNA-binding MarR family transcriptional regulator
MKHAPFVPTVRELVRCYQTFVALSAKRIHAFGLTGPQFDIIVTLGNTPDLTFKELGEKTLITKGTLTGVVDRLEAKGIVKRAPSPRDRRSQILRLTPAGAKLFQKVSPRMLAHLSSAFAGLKAKDHARIDAALRELRSALEKGGKR